MVDTVWPGHDACLRAAAERGWSWDETGDERFLAAARTLHPFPDTRPALEAMRAAGLRLAILSNTDRDLMADTLVQLDVPIDIVVTAQDCGVYKPSERIFSRALEAIAEPPQRILHAAFGCRYDIPPADALGLHAAWINRRGEQRPNGRATDHECWTLWALLDALDARRG